MPSPRSMSAPGSSWTAIARAGGPRGPRPGWTSDGAVGRAQVGDDRGPVVGAGAGPHLDVGRGDLVVRARHGDQPRLLGRSAACASGARPISVDPVDVDGLAAADDQAGDRPVTSEPAPGRGCPAGRWRRQRRAGQGEAVVVVGRRRGPVRRLRGADRRGRRLVAGPVPSSVRRPRPRRPRASQIGPPRRPRPRGSSATAANGIDAAGLGRLHDVAGARRSCRPHRAAGPRRSATPGPARRPRRTTRGARRPSPTASSSIRIRSTPVQDRSTQVVALDPSTHDLLAVDGERRHARRRGSPRRSGPRRVLTRTKPGRSRSPAEIRASRTSSKPAPSSTSSQSAATRAFSVGGSSHQRRVADEAEPGAGPVGPRSSGSSRSARSHGRSIPPHRRPPRSRCRHRRPSSAAATSRLGRVARGPASRPGSRAIAASSSIPLTPSEHSSSRSTSAERQPGRVGLGEARTAERAGDDVPLRVVGRLVRGDLPASTSSWTRLWSPLTWSSSPPATGRPGSRRGWRPATRARLRRPARPRRPSCPASAAADPLPAAYSSIRALALLEGAGDRPVGAASAVVRRRRPAGANSSTTIALATSPPSWPPMPSATTKTGGAAR